jgi:hypothetical protein
MFGAYVALYQEKSLEFPNIPYIIGIVGLQYIITGWSELHSATDAATKDRNQAIGGRIAL